VQVQVQVQAQVQVVLVAFRPFLHHNMQVRSEVANSQICPFFET
jgi:hypothetical protein